MQYGNYVTKPKAQEDNGWHLDEMIEVIEDMVMAMQVLKKEKGNLIVEAPQVITKEIELSNDKTILTLGYKFTLHEPEDEELKSKRWELP